MRLSGDRETDIRADKDAFRDAWRRASFVRGWRIPGDWWTPAVDAVLDAVIEEDGLAGPCARLGAARAEAGVGLAEAFDDLFSFFAVLHRLPPAFVVRRFAESYAESAPEAENSTESIDPLTGFARVDYLRHRLGEVYREAAALGVRAHTRHGLLSVRFDTLPPGWGDVTSRLAAGRVLRSTFSRGETIANVGPSVTAVLTAHDVSVVPDDLSATLRRSAGSDVVIRRIRLPTTLPGALMQLDVLAESDRPESPRK